MNIFIITFVFTLVFSLYLYIKKKRNYFKNYDIPHVPALSNIRNGFFRRRHISDLVKTIYNLDKNAKYIGFYNFIEPMVMIRDPELIKTVTIKNFDHFMNHKPIVDKSLDPLFALNLFQLQNQKWKEARNLLSPAFTSSKMKLMFDLMVNCANNFISHINKQPESIKSMLKTKDLFTRYTNDVIATCAFGLEVDSLENPNNEFYVYGREATNFEGVMTLKFFLANASPTLFKLFRMKIVSDEVTKFFQKIIGSTIKMREEKGITRPDMLQLMMDARGKTSDLLKLDVLEMTAQAFIFFFGGFDTTSTQMCILCHELAINPDIQKKLQDEIDEALTKSNGKPTYENIMNMTYLDAVLNESIRLHPQTPFLDRVCSEKFELPPALPGLKPFTVEKGTSIWIPVAGIHRDKQYYENPEEFNPERFIDNKNLTSQATYLGFGIGPRMCIGNRFAILETKVLIFYLLAKFNLKRNIKTCSPLEYNTKNFSISPPEGFSLAVEARN